MTTWQPLREFLELRKEWSLTKRARGGIDALAGFDHQFHLALRLLIDNYLDSDPGVYFIEALSDVASTKEESITVTQAKRTLTSSTLHDALDELWDIYSLARSRSDVLAGRIRYTVASARAVLSDWPGSRDRWHPRSTGDPESLLSFKNAVRCECLPDLRAQCIQRLLDEFKAEHPVDDVNRFTGRLLNASASGSFDSAVDEVVAELHGLRTAAQRLQRKFRMWGPLDCPPDTITYEPDPRRAVRVGEPLRVADLREGRLAHRRIYDTIKNACEDWLSQADATNGKLPTFWIEGRSGAGKSAALLHLLSQLYRENPSRAIIWVGERPDSIAGAVSWADWAFSEGRQVMIGADDPYLTDRMPDFRRAVTTARDEWEHLSVLPNAVAPFLICCGPSEQCDAVEDDLGGAVELCRFKLLPETDSDLEELADWFQLRTGRPAPRSDPNTLLVQRFFEWSNGDLPDFARRFKRRLLDFDRDRAQNVVFEVVARILCMGRLYSDYPAKPLKRELAADSQLERAFIILGKEEAHFTFTPTDAEESSGGIRLTHPHLADALYRSWFSRPADAGARRLHLRASLEASFEEDDQELSSHLSPLRAVARVARSGDPDVRARIGLIQDELADTISDLYAKRLARRRPDLYETAVWAEVGASLNLAFAPVSIANTLSMVERVTSPNSGLLPACDILLEEKDRLSDPSKGVEAVVQVVGRMAQLCDGRVHPDWVPLATMFVRRVGATAILGSIGEVVRTVPRWPSLAQVISQVATASREEPAGAELVKVWLQKSSEDIFSWGFVLRQLRWSIGHFEEFGELAVRFLVAQPKHPDWGIVWAYLWDDHLLERMMLQKAGLAWLRDRAASAHRTWHRVWQRLWASDCIDFDQRDELRSMAWEWLRSSRFGHYGWQFVWQDLWEEGLDKGGLQQLGLSWLADAPTGHLSWNYLWGTLKRATRRDSSDRAQLFRLGGRWLLEVEPDHPGWKFVWHPMWVEDRLIPVEAERLRSIADSWLQRVDPGHGSWHFVWHAMLVDARSNIVRRQALVDAGLRWLRVVPFSHRGWNYVWDDIFKLYAGEWPWASEVQDVREELLAVGVKWLGSVDIKHGGWSWVWQSLWRESAGDRLLSDEVAGCARRWFEEADITYGGWRFIWIDCWDSVQRTDFERDELAGLGLMWIEKVDSPSAWYQVWERLWSNESKGAGRIQLLEAGAAWLHRVKPTAQGWHHVWCDVSAGLKKESIPLSPLPPYEVTGTEAASGASRKDRRSWQWKDDWQNRWDATSSDDDKLALSFEALDWLGAMDLDEGGWSTVWRILWDSRFGPSRLHPELSKLAIMWLAEVDLAHPRWFQVWELVWEDNGSRERFRSELEFLVRDYIGVKGTSDAARRERVESLLRDTRAPSDT